MARILLGGGVAAARSLNLITNPAMQHSQDAGTNPITMAGIYVLPCRTV